MTKTVALGGRSVTYELTRKKVKNINVRIRADGSVAVSAGKAVPLAAIESFMCEKASFILAAIDKAEARRSVAAADDSSVTLLGERLTLRVIAGEPSVSREGAVLTVSAPDTNDADAVRRIIDAYLDGQCRRVVSELCRDIERRVCDERSRCRELRFRRMVSRWGSCVPSRGALTFNLRLIEAPPECIEYVVAHEYTHFRHPDHSRAFYDELALLIPDWRERKRLLAGCGINLRDR